MSEVLPTATGPITTQATNLNSFIAQVLVKYLLQSHKKLKRLVEGDAALCLHVRGQSVVSCAITQEITGKNTLLITRIPYLHPALLKDRNSTPLCSEVKKSVSPSMNSLQMMNFRSWRTEVTRYGYHFAKPSTVY